MEIVSMINGEVILKEKYPDLSKEQYQPAGIDLKLDRIEEFIIKEDGFYGLVNNTKFLPETKELKMNAKVIDNVWTNVYSLRPGVPYLAVTEEKIKIDEESLQFYKPRSSILRCGANVMTAVGDSGFNGHLSFLIINYLPIDFSIAKGERFAQLVDIRVEGVMNGYDGDYNES